MNQENNSKIINDDTSKLRKNELTTPAIAFGLFIICSAILIWALIWGITTDADPSVAGWPFVMALWVTIGPLNYSFILSIKY